MSDPIAVPPAFAERISLYLEQQRQLQTIVQTAVSTAAVCLGVPQGWQYNPEALAFVPPPEASPVPETVGNPSGAE